MTCIQGQQLKNFNCISLEKPYYMTFGSGGCVSREECIKSDTYPDIYLQSDTFYCSDSESICPSKSKGTAGFYKLPKEEKAEFTECVKCSIDKPISVNNICGQCPEDKIFSYVRLVEQQDACATLNEIQIARNYTGTFDIDFKIYYGRGYTCPENSIVKPLILTLGEDTQTFQKCEWCPLGKQKSGTTCIDCTKEQIADEESHSCIPVGQCQNILSKDGSICYKSTCPLGQIIDKSINGSWRCDTCKDNKFPSADQSECVESCSGNEVLHEATSRCILFEDCDGFYAEDNKKKCLKETCQRTFASFNQPASIVLEKQEGKKYQICQTCPNGSEFVQRDGQAPGNVCKNCKVDFEGTISDFVSGMCIAIENITQYGIFDEKEGYYYPEEHYTCKSGYFFTKRSNSHIEYGFCKKCPSHFPVSNGITCTNNCPLGQVADYYEEKCVAKQSHKCQGRMSSDGLLCSPVCKPGEKMVEGNLCQKCSSDLPYSSKDFKECKSTFDCFIDFELETCMDSASDCQKKGSDYYYQNNSQICKKGCESNEIITLKNNLPSCINKCTEFQFSYSQDEYQYCRNACEETEYAILESKTCKKRTECSNFITGYPNYQCLERCVEGEVLISEKPKDQTYTECVIPTKCKTAIVEQEDGSQICTLNCKKFVNSENKMCIDSCPPSFYQDSQKTNSNYYICYKTCPADKLHFTSPKDGKKQCIQQNECTLNVSQDKTLCSADCQKDEIAFSNDGITTCETKKFDCGTKTYQYAHKNYKICTNTCGDQFISADNKRCVEKCSHLREQIPQDGKKCLKCKENEILVLQSENNYVCKDIDDANILEDKIKTAKAQAAEEMKFKDQIDLLKALITEIAKETHKNLSESKDKSPKERIYEVIDLTKLMIKNIAIPELATAPNKLGSKDNILLQVQKPQKGFRFKTNFLIDLILNDSDYSLTEDKANEDEESLLSLTATIIANNPFCQTDACKTYPLFQLDETQNAVRRILSTNKDYTVQYNLKDSTDIKKYICLSYDLQNPTTDPRKLQTTIGSDNKSITCLVSGSVSIFLDSSCQYIDSQLCNELNNDNDDELNGGEIAGIVIGVFAFVGLTSLIILEIIKRHKLKISNQYQKTQQNQKHNQLHTEERVNTLGINYQEKQV